MATPRGSAAQTRQRIIAAARDLFAQRGIDAVSVRDIAAAAGVSHPLVHHYFGTKTQILDEIVAHEVDKLRSIIATSTPEGAGRTPQAIRAGLEHVLTDGRTSLLLILRTEMRGLTPDCGEAAPLPRRRVFPKEWTDDQPQRSGLPDPRLVTIVIGAAAFGLAALMPWLSAAAALPEQDPDTTRRQLIDVLVELAMLAHGSPGDGERAEMVEAAGIEPASTDASAESLQA
jgi:AcrR family transcriptional regulator